MEEHTVTAQIPVNCSSYQVHYQEYMKRTFRAEMGVYGLNRDVKLETEVKEDKILVRDIFRSTSKGDEFYESEERDPHSACISYLQSLVSLTCTLRGKQNGNLTDFERITLNNLENIFYKVGFTSYFEN